MEKRLCVMIEAVPGDHVDDVAEAMIEEADSHRTAVACMFNGFPIIARPGDSVDDVVNPYLKARSSNT